MLVQPGGTRSCLWKPLKFYAHRIGHLDFNYLKINYIESILIMTLYVDILNSYLKFPH